jgi:hypothetical protein
MACPNGFLKILPRPQLRNLLRPRRKRPEYRDDILIEVDTFEKPVF